MMRTTNILAMSAAAVLLMASCSKDQITQENPGNAINFKAFANAASKVVSVESTTFDEFKVYGRATSSTGFNFEETYTSAAGTAGPWTSGSGIPHYWPSDANENMTFFAHYPIALQDSFPSSSSLAVSESGGNLVIGPVTISQHAADQADLLIARVTQNKSTSSSVALEFAHALTQVEVQAKCSNDHMRVTVKGVKIGSVKSTGSTLTINANISSTAKPSGIWGTSSSPISFMAGGTDKTGLELGSTAKNIMMGDGNFLLIPQTPSAWDGSAAGSGTYIAVLCMIEQNTAPSGSPAAWTQIYPDAAGKYAFAAVAIPTGQQWQPGKKFVYTLDFFNGTSGGGGTVPPEVVDPTDPTDPVNPDIDTTPNPGDPVVGGPITITASVIGWDETPGNAGVTM